jgi:putative Holliday junction resolvase
VVHDAFRPGVRLGIDVGKARVGVARSDLHGMLATPLETVRRATDGSDLARVAQLVEEYAASEVLVGLPLALSGRATASTDDARGFASRVAAAVGCPVRLVDERLSTVSANSVLRASGRSQKSSRMIVDQIAAVVILQQALDTERSTGRPPGALVDAEETPPTP